jgi:hypothetical protein
VSVVSPLSACLAPGKTGSSVVCSRQERWDLERVDLLLERLGRCALSPRQAVDFRVLSSVKEHADKDGFLLVEYRHAQGCGRVYSGKGYQACTKETRSYCSARFYVEDDIVNAFPTIMKQVFNQLGLKTPQLDRYVEDREVVFDELSSGSLDRGRIKGLFIRCLHGGDYFSEAGVYLRVLDRFQREVRSSMQVLLRDPRFAEINTLALANPENPVGRAIALICQRNERKIMQAKTEFTERCHLRVATDLFDGHLREVGDLDGLFRFCSFSDRFCGQVCDETCGRHASLVRSHFHVCAYGFDHYNGHCDHYDGYCANYYCGYFLVYNHGFCVNNDGSDDDPCSPLRSRQ